MKTHDCPTCCGPCDIEIHAATRRVHAWFRDRVLRSIEQVPLPKPRKPRVVTPSGFPLHREARA